MAFVETKASKLKNINSTVENVVFKSYKAKSKTTNERNSQDNSKVKDKQLLDMKKVRYDIIKFGMNGLRSDEKEQSKTALAVSLGAKPPKRKYKNYKELLLEKKIEKDKKVKEESFIKKNKFYMSAKQNKTATRMNMNSKSKESKGLLNVYGKVTSKKSKTPKTF